MAARNPKHIHKYNVYIESAKGKKLGYVWSIKNSTYARELAKAKYPDINPDDIFVQFQVPSPGGLRNKKVMEKYKEQGAGPVTCIAHADDRQKLKDIANEFLKDRGIKLSKEQP